MRVVSVETAKITNTSVKSVRNFADIDSITEETVSYLFGTGLEVEPSEFFITMEADFSLGFPLLTVADVLGLSYLPRLEVNFNWDLNWGVLSFGPAVGCNIVGTLNNTVSAYNLYSVLTGLNIGYRTAFDFPLNIFIKAAPGAAYSILIYPAVVTGVEAIIFEALSFSITSDIGVIFMISENIGLSAYGRFAYVIFSADDLITAAPGIGVIYRY